MEVSSSLRRLFVTKTGIGGAHNGQSAQGPQQGSGKETSKSLRGSIDIGGDLSLFPPPLGGLRGQCINISVCHVFFALCSDVEGRWCT